MSGRAGQALRMRDNGKSWTEISDRLGISPTEAQALVAPLKAQRRSDLARTETNERLRGLLDECQGQQCGHVRKDHDEDGCTVCGAERRVWRVEQEGQDDVWVTAARKPTRPADFPRHLWWFAFLENAGCDEFVEKSKTWLPWNTRWRADRVMAPRPKPSEVKAEGPEGPFWRWRASGGGRWSERPMVPQVARKRKRRGRPKRGIDP